MEWRSVTTGRCGRGATTRFGQLGNDTTVARSLAAPVVGLQDVVAISLGPGRLPLPAAAVHALAVTSSGAVMGWGSNDHNQLGNQLPGIYRLPVQIPGLSGVQIRAVSAGGRHSLALTADGGVLAWGADERGQLGTGSGSGTPGATPAAVRRADGTALTGVVSIAAAETFGVAVTADGSAWSWGDRSYGYLADGSDMSGATAAQARRPFADRVRRDNGLLQTDALAVDGRFDGATARDPEPSGGSVADLSDGECHRRRDHASVRSGRRCRMPTRTSSTSGRRRARTTCWRRAC